MERVSFDFYHDLTSIMLELYFSVIRDTGIDVLELLPEDTIANKSLLRSIYQLLATTGWVNFIEVPIIHNKSQEALEEILHNVKLLNSHYVALQRGNPDFPVKYEAIHKYLASITKEIPPDVSGLMLAMNLILPIQRIFFSRFYPEDLEWRSFELYDACYRKIRTDQGVLESIFSRFIEDLWSQTDREAARNRLVSAIDSVSAIDGESVDLEVPEYDGIIVESGFTPVEAVRSVINRFFGPEKATLLWTAFESWAGMVHPAQIPKFLINFCSSYEEFSSYTLSGLANLLAYEFGIDLYSFGYVNEDQPWRTEFVHHVIARDPRFGLTSSEMREPIARFISRSRRDSLKHVDKSIEVYFSTLVNLMASPGNDFVAGILIARIEAIMLGHKARDIVTCALEEDCAHLVLGKLVSTNGIHPVFELLDSFEVSSLMFRSLPFTSYQQTWLQAAKQTLERKLLESLKERDYVQSFLVVSDQLFKFLKRILGMTRALTVDESSRLLDIYISLEIETPGSAPFSEQVDAIENLMSQIL